MLERLTDNKNEKVDAIEQLTLTIKLRNLVSKNAEIEDFYQLVSRQTPIISFIESVFMLLISAYDSTEHGSMQYYLGLEALWMIHDMVVSTEVEQLNELLLTDDGPSNLLQYIDRAMRSNDVALVEMSTMFLSNAMERKETAVIVKDHVPIFDSLYTLLEDIEKLEIYTVTNVLGAISRLCMNDLFEVDQVKRFTGVFATALSMPDPDTKVFAMQALIYLTNNASEEVLG